MLDRKFILEQESLVVSNLAKRGEDFGKHIAEFLVLEKQRREVLQQAENIRHERKSLQEQFRTDHSDELKLKLKSISDRLKEIETRLKDFDQLSEEKLVMIPNLLHPKVPTGSTSEENVEVFKDEKDLAKRKDVGVIPHWQLTGKKNAVDFDRAAQMSSARFFSLRGDFAKLERALINFMLDTHQKNGYTEMVVPYFANYQSLFGTGQFPKFMSDVFKIEGRDLYPIPTAEVSLVNLYRDTILEEKELDISVCAFSPCFRSEAGSYGLDTKGLIRLHQFHKVELVKITHPDRSETEHAAMLQDAKRILDLLGLPYRVVMLCSGDTGFSSMITYDIEVWVPSQRQYREISSVSNCGDFQSRRAKIRYRHTDSQGHKKTQLVHTLNGSGLAVGRTFLALVEYFQDGQGGIEIPEVLIPYMGGQRHIQW
jgi:seryl-tRNA synthetase